MEVESRHGSLGKYICKADGMEMQKKQKQKFLEAKSDKVAFELCMYVVMEDGKYYVEEQGVAKASTALPSLLGQRLTLTKRTTLLGLGLLGLLGLLHT